MAHTAQIQPHHYFVTGVAAGLLAGVATGVADKLLGRLVSKEQKRRDRMVREGTAHEVAGPRFGERITGHALDEQEQQRAKAIFNVTYGVGWGLVYAGVRRYLPRLSRPAALPFGVVFFAACDGLLAPLLKVSPPLWEIPWQPNAKELGNHLAWAASAEMVHRAAAEIRSQKSGASQEPGVRSQESGEKLQKPPILNPEF